MNQFENELCSKIQNFLNEYERDNYFYRRWEVERAIDRDFFKLMNNPIRTASPEFVFNPDVIDYLQISMNSKILFWHFISTHSNEDVEIEIQAMVEEYKSENEKGYGLPSTAIHNQGLMRCIYLSDDEGLIDIFKRHLPMPKPHVFASNNVPNEIKEYHAKDNRVLVVLQDKPNAIKLLTKKTIKEQRKFRAKKRYEEELVRIANRREWKYWMKNNAITAEQIIREANTPYFPQCGSNLAQRIVRIAEQVSLFSSVHHFTSKKHLAAIFNDALYGRKNLLNNYMLFQPASLYSCDVMDGDGNVICFGPFTIDPKAQGPNGVKLTFDLKKIIRNNLTIFFKQRDLGFALNKIRSLIIGKQTFYFSQTNIVRCADPGFSYLSFYRSEFGECRGVAGLPNCALISYNVAKIHQILILNFFKFLDSPFSESIQSIRDNIYAALGGLDDQEMAAVLKDLGQKFSDTSEFNFYGAYQIDFNALIEISDTDSRFTLNLPTLIENLNRNDIALLQEAQLKIPTVFKSHRFLDYLLTKVHADKGKAVLLEMASECERPARFSMLSDNPRAGANEEKLFEEVPSFRSYKS